MPSKYPKGSKWRRWDLHIHTPVSVLYNQFKGWDTYINALESADANICAIGITDYASIEGFKKLYIEKNENNRLQNLHLIIPNIEFRISPFTKAGAAINIHILVDVSDSNHIDNIEDALSRFTFTFNEQKYPCNQIGLTNLGKVYKQDSAITDEVAYREGILQFKPSFDSFKDWFKNEAWLKKHSIIAVSNSSNDGASGLSHDDGYKAVRLEIYRFSHMVLSSNPNDRIYFLGQGVDTEDELERTINGKKPCVHGSDAHKEDKLFKPDLDRYCWIKADPTFEGLRQILYEPEARVHIGKTIPDTRDENRIIKSLHFKNSNGWFADIKFPINSALVSVIGGKGSGKTALLDLTAFATGSWKENKASFLYKAHKELIGTEITVEWLGGSPDNKKIEKSLLPGKENKVRYLSQQFVEQLCSEDRVGLELVNEIENVIFEYLDDTEKLGKTSFADLRTTKTERIGEQKIRLRAAITKLNEEIQHLNQEQRSLPSKDKRIDELKNEKEGLKKQIPSFDNEEEQKIEEELRKLRDLRKEIVEKISERKQLVEFIMKVRDRVEGFKEDMNEFYEQLKGDLAYIGIEDGTVGNFEPLFKGDVITPLNQKNDKLEQEIKEISGLDTDAYPEKITHKSIDKRIAELEAKSTTDQAKKQKSIEIQKRIQAIDTEIEKLNKAIEAIKSIKSKQLDKINERWEKYLNYFENLKAEQKILEELYSSLSQTLGAGNEEEKNLQFYIKWQANTNDWTKQGESLLNQRKKGPYRASGDLAAKAKETIEQYWIVGDNDNIKKALQELRESFDNEAYTLQTQLLDGISESQFDDWLYSTEHISLNYGIKHDGLELENLSPGVKGIVLLILYLEMDKNDRRPLLIDQPEENLDNQSVYKVLTKYFQRAKTRRQIILITHNPNLVVNTDSEQVIVASFEKTPPLGATKITYSSGALEDTRKDSTGQDLGTREKVCEILEGGEAAFHMRERRYSFDRG
jgi:ABC-type lipoprotein export system ATPase subunit